MCFDNDVRMYDLRWMDWVGMDRVLLGFNVEPNMLARLRLMYDGMGLVLCVGSINGLGFDGNWDDGWMGGWMNE